MMIINNGNILVFTFGPGRKGVGRLYRKDGEESLCDFPIECAIKKRDEFTEMIANVVAITHGLSRADCAYRNYKDRIFKYIFRDSW